MTNWRRLYTDASLALDEYQNEVVPGLRKTIEELQNKNKWIPATERLPEENCLVLVVQRTGWGGDPVVRVARWNTCDWLSDDGREIWITHWMPLPELPKGG